MANINKGGADHSIQKRLKRAFGVQIAVLILGCTAFVWMQIQLRDARRWTDESAETIALMEQLRADTFRQVSGLRAYAMTGHKSYLQAQVEGREDYDASVARLQKITQRDPAQEARMVELLELLRDWRDTIAAPAVDLANRGGKFSDIATALTSVEAELILRRGVNLLGEMLTAERRSLATRQQRNEIFAQIMLVLIVLMVIVGILLARAAMRSLQGLIGHPLEELARLVPTLASGYEAEIPFKERHDEIGQLAIGFKQFRDASVAQRRSSWVSEHSTNIIALLQTCENESQFGEVLLRELCHSVEAGYALAYRWDDNGDALEWCAAYGLPDAALTAKRFRRGEGLIGQAMTEGRIIELCPVPEGYSKIVSGLGAAPPQALMFMPLSARGHVIAVLEIGLLRPPREDDRALLDQVLVTVALGWDALSRGLRTRELLHESQAQSEELQASEEALRVQQEQMRSVNEALSRRTEQLEAQGRQLKSSEESLRSQTEELRSINAALEDKTEALRQRQSELELARGAEKKRALELEQASRYKSEFLANMSHELRTPLNSMLILSRTLADNFDGHLDEEEIESARIIHESGQSLLQLINDILDLSKVEAGKMDFYAEDVALEERLQALVKRFKPLAEEKGLQCQLSYAADMPATLHTDPKRLMQILTNLLSNGFKFTEAGRVDLIAERVEGGVAFSVKDTGIGIPEEQLQRVFQAFEQADSSTSRRFGGTGLGLSIVNGLTTRLGGAVRVSSVEGEGSTFTVYLPLAPEHGIPAAAQTAEGLMHIAASSDAYADDTQGMPLLTEKAHPTGAPVEIPRPVAADLDGTEAAESPVGPPVVLIVEDEADFAEALSTIVSKRGLEVMIARNGSEAIAIARKRQLFAVLMDQNLPDMNNPELIKMLKNNPHTADVPMHVVSGRGKEPATPLEDVNAAKAKPASAPQILQVLDEIAPERRAHSRKILLLVHDEERRAALFDLLGKQHMEVIECSKIEEGLKMLEATPMDGLVVDPDLPDSDVPQFLAQVADMDQAPAVVVYVSRELSNDETLSLSEHSQSIVMHGARSPERLLDEVTLFLHALDPNKFSKARTEEQKHPAAADLGGKTVLVVDDDMRNVFALSKALRSHGLNVVMAQDGQKALGQLKARNDIDIVLMDIMMPGMDGYETTRRIRENPAWLDLPIIAVTAKAMTGDRDKCMEAGANDYCPKPIDVDSLLSQMQGLV